MLLSLIVLIPLSASVLKRPARLGARLADDQQPPGDSGKVITLPVSRQRLADLPGRPGGQRHGAGDSVVGAGVT